MELELLAIIWACKKTGAFLEGIDFTILMDHKPLILIFCDYSLAEIENKRLQLLRMKIDHLPYAFKWIEGTNNTVASAFFRAPSRRPMPDNQLDKPHDKLHLIAAHPAMTPRWRSTPFLGITTTTRSSTKPYRHHFGPSSLPDPRSRQC